jgi:phosphoglycerate dehydrogenase-like enzyme
MKPGVRIINCSRGGVLDEQALYDAMKTGKVAGAALDVFEKEPNTDSPLFNSTTSLLLRTWALPLRRPNYAWPVM